MITIHLTRKEYDAAISNAPKFMATHYQSMKREWSLNGVSVTGSAEAVSTLRKFAAS